MAPRSSPLLSPVFTLDEARAHGLTDYDLYRAGLESPTPGLRMAAGHQPDPLQVAGKLATRDPSLILTHQTAAHLWGLWLPSSMREPTIHLARRRGHGGIPRVDGTTGHLTAAQDQDLRMIRGVAITSPAWTWTDLASERLTLRELVAAGDSLLQRPDGPPRSGRHEGMNPLSTLAEMRELVGRRPGISGAPLLRQALELVRTGVDSSPESWVRTGLLDEGWPEPEVNPLLSFEDGWSVRPDLAYRQWRIAIQYEGQHHFTEAQQYASDIHRDDRLSQRGWQTIRLSSRVLTPVGWGEFTDGLRRAVQRQTR